MEKPDWADSSRLRARAGKDGLCMALQESKSINRACLKPHFRQTHPDSGLLHGGERRRKADFPKKSAAIRALCGDKKDLLIFLKKGVAGIFE
ncbi:hypothetical protein [Yoonia rosea]|uniref:hypothetical protein n=1 Tax=Yoonia rosea TaxID=287098 RepID=UPI0010541C7D|nr:hypothetical protein [Yoonia rosea]